MNKTFRFIKTIRNRSIDVSIWVVLFGLVFILFFANDQYTNINNYMNILREASFLCVAALGMTAIIITKNTDLSIGTMIALISVISFKIMPVIGIWPTILSAVCLGILFEMINGFFIVYLKIYAFILTLGMQYIYRGIAYIITQEKVLQVPVKEYTKIGNSNLFASGSFDGIPLPVILVIPLIVFAYVLLHRTSFGRKVFAVGNNEKAALLMGIKVEKTKFLAYVLLGFFNGIAAVMISSRLWIASAEMRPNYEFDVITVVVIGGCALSGGKGNILKTMAAAVFFAMISNIINQFNVDPYMQYIIRAMLLVMAFSIPKIKTVVSGIAEKHRYKNMIDNQKG